MIQIATPISHLFEDEAAARAIVDASDCLECRERSIESEAPDQHLLHFDLNLVHPWDDETKTYVRRAISLKLEIKLISFHVACNCDAPVLDGVMFQAGGRRYGRDEMLENARVNAAWLREHLPDGTPIAIENNNYYPTDAYEKVTEGAFLSEIANEIDSAFLLDIAHAKVTAHNTDTDLETYLESLPLDRTIQIHVCRPTIRDDGLAVDTHDALDEAGYAEIRELAERLNPRYVTLEYYKDAWELVEMLGVLRKALS
jgi:uncharacterized protein (UPF0276 family)